MPIPNYHYHDCDILLSKRDTIPSFIRVYLKRSPRQQALKDKGTAKTCGISVASVTVTIGELGKLRPRSRKSSTKSVEMYRMCGAWASLASLNRILSRY